LYVGSEQPCTSTDHHEAILQRLADHAATALVNAWLFAQVKRGRERLQILSRQLLEAQEAERRLIAHELHEEAGQLLASVHLALLEAARRIKAACPASQVIIVTVHTEDAYRQAAEASGADAFLVKKTLMTTLLPTIGRLRATTSPRRTCPEG
jgi:DNA-binding NarL/FixJ family response regulator